MVGIEDHLWIVGYWLHVMNMVAHFSACLTRPASSDDHCFTEQLVLASQEKPEAQDPPLLKELPACDELSLAKGQQHLHGINEMRGTAL